MAENANESKKPTDDKDDSPPQNKHGVLTTQDTPKEPDETRVSATDPGHKDKKD